MNLIPIKIHPFWRDDTIVHTTNNTQSYIIYINYQKNWAILWTGIGKIEGIEG